MTGVYEIVAVRYGTLASRKSDLFLRWDAYDEPDADQRLDYFFYVLRDGERTILVDTGFAPESGTRRGRTCLCAPRAAVERLGIAASDISSVIVTHLHYDHVGNLDAFADAQLLVPGRELEFWTSPLARRPQFWVHVDAECVAEVQAADRQGRVTRFGGRTEILPGITAITVGGHSPGQQVLVVQTAGRPVVLASDAAHLYEELELDRPFAITVDLVEMYQAYELLRDLERERGAVVVPGHDPSVTTRFPALGGDAAGIGYQLA